MRAPDLLGAQFGVTSYAEPPHVDEASRRSAPRPLADADGLERVTRSQGLQPLSSSTANRSSGGLQQLQRWAGPAQPAPIPDTPKVHLVERKHGHLVADPYRWLELPATQSQAVLPHQAHKIQTWVDAQNARTEHFLGQHKALLKSLRDRYYELSARPSVGRPQRVNNLGTIQWRQEKGGEPRKLYLDRSDTKWSDGAKVAGEILFDERALAAQLGLPPSSFVASTEVSPNGAYVAVSFGEYHGDDRRKIAIVDTTSKQPVGELLSGAKWGQLMWLDDTRLVYGKVHLSERELAMNAPDADHRQMVHEVGTRQSQDVELFAADREPWVHTTLWRDGTRLYRRRSFVGTARSVLESAQFDAEEILAGRTKFFPVYDREGVEQIVGCIPGTDRYLVRVKDEASGTGELAYVDLNDPAREWVTLVPPVPGREMEKAILAGEHLVVDYQVNLSSRLAVYKHDGELLREVDLQEAGLPAGSIGSMRYNRESKKLVVSYASPLTPPRDYEIDPATGGVKALEDDGYPFDPSRFTVEQVTFTSKDGTEIPMQLIRAKDGFARDGDNPTILYGYGGFEIDVAHNTFISSALIPFLEAGGTIALPALRGGAELGDAWHEAGMRHNKQRVFDDFIGAAEHLIATGVTSPERLAIMGASNGGLLVGAAVTQRPELFKAAVPHAGVMDMARFTEFSSGRWWVHEYGDPADPDDFANMMAYSPVHNVRDGEYPAVLVTTGRYDSRVDPAHSLKFLAELQDHQRGEAPILGYVNPDSGHWPNRHAERKSEFLALKMTFVMSQLGMSATPPTMA